MMYEEQKRRLIALLSEMSPGGVGTHLKAPDGLASTNGWRNSRRHVRVV